MNDADVSLREWETLTPDAGTPLANRSLKDTHAQQVTRDLADLGRIEVLELARGLEIRATSFVGRLILGDLTITVQPKLSGAPLINLLRYAYGLRQLALYEPVEYATRKWAFHDLLIQQLAAEVAELLARGLHRSYERTPADLANPRGRIDFDRIAGMIHQPTATLPCVHHPRTENNVLNQVMLSGLVYAAGMTIDTDLRADVTKLAKTLAANISLKQLSLDLLRDAIKHVDRRTTVYASALSIIELLFQSQGISLEGEGRRIRLPGFLFDMNRFFQALISRFLHDHLEEYEIQDEYRLKELFSYDPDCNPQRRSAPVQRRDLIILRGRKIAAILDAKYRDLWERPLPREMLYQLALYALGQTDDQRKAVILYPTLTSNASDQAIRLRDLDTGTFHAQVILRPVNLLELELLLRNTDWHRNRQKAALAHELSFGATQEN